MAKKAEPKLDFDIDKIIAFLEAINEADFLEAPLEIDASDPDLMAQQFNEVMVMLADDEELLKTIENWADMVDFYNDELPERFKDDEGNAEESGGEGNEEKTSGEDDGESGDESGEEGNKEETAGEDSDDEETPACPNFGKFNPKDDECKDCEASYPDEYKSCVAKSKPVEEKPKRTSKAEPKKEEKKAKEENPSKEEKGEEPKKGRGRPKKEEKKDEEEKPSKEKSKKEEAPKEEKPKRSFARKTTKENTEEEKPSPKRDRKALASLTGKQFAEYLKRISTGGAINECFIKSDQAGLHCLVNNESVSLLVSVHSGFNIGYIGEFVLGDISKVIKFAQNVGDGQLDINIEPERIIISGYSNKIRFLHADKGALQTTPDDDVDIGEISDIMTGVTIINPDSIKDIIFDTRLIKSDVLTIAFEDNKLTLIGGTENTDKFELSLKDPDVTGEIVDRDFKISAFDFVKCLSVVVTRNEPIELLFSSENEEPIAVRQGEDIWVFSLTEETSK